MKPLLTSPDLRSGLVLAGFTCLAVLLLSGLWTATRPAIESARHQLLLEGLDELLPPGSFDNDPVDDRIAVNAAALGTDQPLDVYRARRGQTDAALVIETVAPDGYSGSIQLLLACTRAGRILGVRVTGHRETPGLGDAIEASRSDWIRQFDQMTIAQLPPSAWQLQTQGGRFDQISGATVTSQAVVSAVHHTLIWYRRHADALFNARRGSRLTLRAPVQ